jgi:hypothetical protein
VTFSDLLEAPSGFNELVQVARECDDRVIRTAHNEQRINGGHGNSQNSEERRAANAANAPLSFRRQA